MPSSELYVWFLADPSAPGVQPISQCVPSPGPLESAILSAKGTLTQGTYPWTRRVEIRNEKDVVLNSWSVDA